MRGFPALTEIDPEKALACAPNYCCPYETSRLHGEGSFLVCESGHRFRVDRGIPVFARRPRREEFPAGIGAVRASEKSAVDPFVNQWIVNTNGNLYRRAQGRLARYPIPRWPFAQRAFGQLVDLGCGWGRWTIAAARAGYSAIGIDPHVHALQAARRVASQLGVRADYICAGAEELPFRSGTIDAVFSYSVLQHLDKLKVRGILHEATRILKPGGRTWIQLPNRTGLRNLYLQMRRGFRRARPKTFEMRYWSIAEIRQGFQDAGLAIARITADGFFSQNPQISDLDIVSLVGKIVVPISFAGTKLCSTFPPLVKLADSIWIEAIKPADS